MKINYIQASHEMKNITGVIAEDVFDLDGVGLLVIIATGAGNQAAACAQITYELLDEIEREEWFKEERNESPNIP